MPAAGGAIAVWLQFDLFFLPGPLLSSTSPIHAVSAMSAMLVAGIAVIGPLYRPTMGVLSLVGWVSFGLSSVYALMIYVLYRYGE